MTRENLMNVDELKRLFAQSGLDAVVAVSQPNVLYTTGALIETQMLVPERLALAVLTAQGDNSLLVCNIEESFCQEQSWIKDIRSYVEFAESPLSLLAQLMEEKGLSKSRIGIEKRYLSTACYEELVDLLPHARFEACDWLFDEVRSIKTEGEIQRYRQAGQATERAIVEAFSGWKPGQTELDLKRSIRDRLAAMGASVGFCMLAAGDQIFHAHPTARDRQLQPGDAVQIDMGGKFDVYGADIARLGIVGRPTELQVEIYRKHRQVQRGAIASLRPGMRACEVYEYCRRAYADVGLGFGFPHVGHGFGLALHESPVLQPYNTHELRSNMLLCIEPVYWDDVVGCWCVEDMVVIREDGAEILTTYADTEDLFVLG